MHRLRASDEATQHRQVVSQFEIGRAAWQRSVGQALARSLTLVCSALGPPTLRKPALYGIGGVAAYWSWLRLAVILT